MGMYGIRFMKITYSLLVQLGTLPNSICLNSYQLRLLGIGWPPKHGWVTPLLGREISTELVSCLMELRGPRKKEERRRVLVKYGHTAKELFQARLFAS
jgi:hypothetical protein